MRGARLAVLLITAAVAAPMPASAQTRPAATTSAPVALGVPLSDASAQKLLQMDERISQVRDMSTRFRQEKHTALTKKPIVSSGTIRVKGSVTLWDTEKPARSIMRFDEKELRVYYPGEKTLEIYRLDQQMAKMAASPLPRLALLRQTFEIMQSLSQPADPRYLSLILTPREASLREHVTSIDVLLDLEQGNMKQMTMEDPDGERTLLAFEDVRINRGLEEAELELKVPPEAKVVRPLEALEPRQAR